MLLHSRAAFHTVRHLTLSAARPTSAAAATPSRRILLSNPSTSSSILRNPTLQRRTMASAVAKRLAGKTVVITGASSGIGRATAFELARTAPQQGLRLILTARRHDELAKIAAEIAKEVGDGEGAVQVLPVQLDIADPAAVRAFVPALPQEWRDINVLVNNA
jgi:3-hydroxy acid dehydrogenase / malonic semialdehyde reductase